MMMTKIKTILGRVYNYTLQVKHIEWFFKWVEWITLTAVLCFAWWYTKSYFLLPLVIISLLFTWHSSFRGVGIFIAPVINKLALNESQSKALHQIIAGFLSLYFLIMFIFLAIGISKAG